MKMEIEMKTIGQPFRLGMWTVKQPNIPEFIAMWQKSADWISQHLPDEGEGILLQDTEQPNRFISFASSTDIEKAQEVMSRTDYEELFSRVRALCDEVQPHRMKVVGYSSSAKNE
jgi:hypothetical protein